jgi:choline dehydrogenase
LWLERNGQDLEERIDLNLLSDAEDESVLALGLAILRRIMAAPAFGRYAAKETLPGPDVQTDETLRDFVRTHVGPGYHPVGTCRMGRASERTAVVDPYLKVIGLENVRVADASIMPDIPAGNTNAPSIMIGEKASDLILADSA